MMGCENSYKKIYEDKNILVVYKNNKLSVQKDKKGNLGLKELLEKEYKEIFLINRLDTNVCGLVLFGKNKDTAAKLSKIVQNHEVEKVYYAVVQGDVKEKDTLVNWIFKNQRLNISKVVNKNSPSSKEAILSYEKLEKFEYEDEEYSLVKINLVTGRHHQIRVQFAHIGHFIYGDRKYSNMYKVNNEGIALCAKSLKFVNPHTKKEMLFECDLPKSSIWKCIK